ncbi:MULTISPECIES: ArsR/SmtB family transcription factor [Nocardiopsidaceae]|uniref:Winged helix-turn-helix domain-containing protein n=1 Tax=Streptomonospora nanhaiensis TaxID=1323731 RepID=A0ABY6YVU3_9ACTN|nr:winged helix-turn-helix domain-containing protein [Streptomonospora nanhaiensis]WAE76523.1 winged helix-turn-helix domain-containing protein [Streptomonospora nanhaiensis]
MDRTTEQRLADLEARVAELEGRAEAAPAPPGGGGGTEGAPGGAFFALEALRGHAAGRGAVVFAGIVRDGDGEDAIEWQQGLPVDRLAGADWSRAAAVLDALGHPVRLHLLHAVWEGTGTVAGLAELSGFGTTGQIYHHVNLLVAAGWLTTVRRGHYIVPPERVVPLLAVLTAAGGAS